MALKITQLELLQLTLLEQIFNRLPTSIKEKVQQKLARGKPQADSFTLRLQRSQSHIEINKVNTVRIVRPLK